MTKHSAALLKPRGTDSKPHERLKAWSACHELVLAVYRETAGWPDSETHGLAAQARAVAFSAALNLAEGSAKPGIREFRHGLGVALGSLGELACILVIARDIGVMEGSAFGEVEVLRDHASRLTKGLDRALQRRMTPRELAASAYS
jgi:four helix bundle protein